MTEHPIFPSSTTSGVDPLLDRVGAPGVPRDVARADEMMLLFLERNGADLDRAALEYFRSGANMAQTIAALVTATAPGADDAVLDFGSGYGRVLRFLARRFGAQRFWASDVYAAGLDFQMERHGVHTLLSHTDPAQFAAPRRFRLIFSISVFTHLPELAFDAWLRRLLAALAPGGVLAFTVHDEAVLNVGDALPENGLLFLRQSESRSLSTEDYGSTWVNERFLRAAAARADAEAQVLRLPRAICDYQDLIVIAPQGSTLPAVAAIPIEPAFYLEQCAVAELGKLTVRGWSFARAIDGSAPNSVVEIAAELVHAGKVVAQAGAAPLERPDVPAVFGAEAALHSGFAFTLALPEALPHAGTQLLVTMKLHSGARFVGYAAPLASALLDGHARRLTFAEQEAHREHGRHVFREQHLERDLTALQQRIQAMESTLTWRLRRRLRRLLGMNPTP